MPRPIRFLGAGESPASTADDDLAFRMAMADVFVKFVGAFVFLAGAAFITEIVLSLVSRFCSSLPKAERGLEKKVLQSLPKLTLTVDSASGFSDCTICLQELTAGNEIRVLPRCGHVFHLACINPWLRSHSSCPTCRQIVAPPDAAGSSKKCAASLAVASSYGGRVRAEAQAVDEARLKEREDGTRIRVLVGPSHKCVTSSAAASSCGRCNGAEAEGVDEASPNQREDGRTRITILFGPSQDRATSLATCGGHSGAKVEGVDEARLKLGEDGAKIRIIVTAS